MPLLLQPVASVVSSQKRARGPGRFGPRPPVLNPSRTYAIVRQVGSGMARTRQTTSVYKVIFSNQGQVYEVFARQVSQGGLFGFVEVEQIVFGERSQLIADPSEERLKTEFAGVKRVFIPLHSIVRIDEVEKEGAGRISGSDGSPSTPRVLPIPMPVPGLKNEPR